MILSVHNVLRHFVLICLLLVSVVWAGPKTNIVVFLSDDHG